MLPYFFRHYEPFVDQFFISDDGSADGSLDFLQRHPKVKVCYCENKNGSYIERSRDFWNSAWKESRGEANWVINCNIDEHLYHKDIVEYLGHCSRAKITILPSRGYEMISRDFPSAGGRLCETIVRGSALPELSKIVIFDPNAIEEINYSCGRHQADPTGNVVFPPDTELKILHYKFLGIKYLEKRYAELRQGLSADDIARKRGYQYTQNFSALQKKFKMIETRAVDVISAANADIPEIVSSSPFRFFLHRFLTLISCIFTKLFRKHKTTRGCINE